MKGVPKCKVNKKSTRGHPSIRGHPNIRGCPGRKGMPSGDALWGCPIRVLVDSRARTGISDARALTPARSLMMMMMMIGKYR